MSTPPPPRLPGRLHESLQRKRRTARWLILFERAWPALWPPLGVLGLLTCAGLLGLPQRLPPMWHVALLAVVLGAIGVLGWRALRHVSLPNEAAADRRLERESGLRHRPLAALTDHPEQSTGDPALWRAHVERLAATVGTLRLGLPHPGLAGRDPRAWRALLLVLLVMSLGIAGADAPARLLAAAVPVFPPAVPPPAPRLQAWLTPPGFTGMAPILLDAAHPDVSAPSGSRLTATLSGGSGGTPVLSLAGHESAFQPLDAASWQASATLSSGGTLVVRRGTGEIGRWQISAVEDVPPSLLWAATPTPTRGKSPQLRLPWQVAHPYGVADLHAELRLQERPRAPPLLVQIPLSGAPRSAKGTEFADLIAHPWAGLAVTATLIGHDTAGLAGHSAARTFAMPERGFLNPAARALIAVRKMLALHPEERGPPLGALQRLAEDASVWEGDSGGYLNLRAIMDRLARTPIGGEAEQNAIDKAQAGLWLLALHLEEGAPSRTAQALAQARRALHEAFQAAHPRTGVKPEQNGQRQNGQRQNGQNQNGQKQNAQDQNAQKQNPQNQDQQNKGAQNQNPHDQKPLSPETKAELQKREQALQQALQRYLQALRRQSQTDPRHAAPPEQRAMDAQQALRQMQQATQDDRMDEAKQRMAELDQALDALEQASRDMQSTPEQRKRAAQRQRGQKQMGVLGDVIRREARILDHAQARAAPPDPMRNNSLDFPPMQTFDYNHPPGSRQDPPAAQAERHDDRGQQNALRRALGVLMQQFGDLTGQVPHNLGDADMGMHDAVQALDGAKDDKAAEAAQRTIAALQKGGQSMQQQLAQRFGRGSRTGEGQDPGADPSSQGQDDQGQGQGAMDAERPRDDPFGRALQEGSAGMNDGGETAVPETMEQARTREVQQELRRRGADRSRPQRELDYIGRLLEGP